MKADLRRLASILGIIAPAAVACTMADREGELLEDSESGVSTPAARQAEALTAATCITIRRGKLGQVGDATIKKNVPVHNFGGQPILRVSDKDEALLRFDLSAVPRGASIQSGKLQLYVGGDNGSGTVEVHRVTAPWVESKVTFAEFHQQFDARLVAEFRAQTPTALKSIDVSALVKGWSAGEANYGLLLKPGRDHQPRCAHDDDEDGDPTVFVSSDGANLSKRPALEICYTLAKDYCTTSPCQNGGTCLNGASGYTCQCASGFDGPECQHAIDRCSPNPCRNGGTCTDTPSGFTCNCPLGFEGATCEVNLDECTSNPCQNGGTCTDGIASFACTCAPGYDGVACEHLIDNCASEPCHNGGTCRNLTTGYACTCAPGYGGTTCDVNVDDCSPNACLNGGTCIDGINTYTCSCAPDWGGSHCETNLNTCVQIPCLNGGVCTSTAGSYTCTCPAGLAGPNCEIDLDDCGTNPCQNGGLCVDGVNAFSCTCQPGWTGTLCDEQTGAPCLLDTDCESGVFCDSVAHVCGIPGAQPNLGLTENPSAFPDTCFPGMTLVGTFCVDQYEAALLEVLSDGSTHPWSPYEAPGSSRRVRAVSLAGAVPQTQTSQREAFSACQNAGKRLCTDSEWLRVCMGPDLANLYPYGPTRIDLACNDTPGGIIALTGSFASCASADAVYDVIGNVGEWTADPAGTFRGDNLYRAGNGPGCLNATTAHDTLHSDATVGFRCCADPG